MKAPRVMLAAPSSGSGKTMITCGLLQALVDRGMKVASFKVGPDYIDPMFHRKVIGTRSGNLDLFFAGAEMLPKLFVKDSRGADINVIEGVMGYYDGISAARPGGSSWDTARTLGCPAVLIVDARGQSLSALATLRGFRDMVPESLIAGVIFNRMAERIFEELRPEVERLGVKPLGYVPRSPELVVESRHLGLVSPDEMSDLKERLRRLAATLERTIDIDALIALAGTAPELVCGEPEQPEPCRPVTIAVAEDEAFSFFYRDNLELIEALGGRLETFSPLRDKALPDDARGLLLCGGYPELYARELSENAPMLTSIKGAIGRGMPCLAECGGFLYLQEQIEDAGGVPRKTAGALPGSSRNTGRLGRFGYITLSPARDNAYLPEGETIRGHEFHYYDSTECGDALEARKPIGGRSWLCCHQRGALLAGFPHFFYWSNPELVVRFLRFCEEWIR